MALTTDIRLQVTATLTKAIGALGGALSPEVALRLMLTSGVGLNNADKMYYARPTIAGSATLSLDVATGGGLVDLYGDAIAMARVKLIAVKSDLTICPNTVNLTRPAAGVPFLLASSDAVPVRPGGAVYLVAPDAVGYVTTATTADLIDLVNTAAGNVQPEILIIGASA